MKKVANIKNEALRKEQLDTLVEVLEFFRSKDDLELFIACFLTDSVKAFLAQIFNLKLFNLFNRVNNKKSQLQMHTNASKRVGNY